jgi:hypothetical protein
MSLKGYDEKGKSIQARKMATNLGKKMAEQKDKKGRSIHHTQMGQKGGKIGGKRTMSLEGYDENGKSIRARKSGKIGGLKKKDNCMKDTLQRYASIVVIRCRCGSKDSVRLKGEDEYLHHKDKFCGCSSCKTRKRFDQINGPLTFTQNERDDINLAKKKIELHITK